jgi:hypothetical protein
MKTAKEWHDEIGYASTCPKLTKHRTDKIREIQLESLEHAASLLTANADSPVRGFNSLWRLIIKLRKSKTVAAQPKRELTYSPAERNK